jgi:RHH-type proline utilization regulon transcriptional repressor/proline dehydrogenase/delta 1-pyrroline-5-carboxylate dehydrogenase
VQLTVDAEEAERLELTLAIFADLSRQAPDFASFGIAVQAYQRRAPQVIAFLDALARQCRRPIPVRLIKGAYWDTEIKRAQQQALASYPVYTRKVNTDVAYLACAQQLLAAGDSLLPQFATHNGHTIAWLLAHAPDHDDWEFQRLHGMGESLYAAVFAMAGRPVACRVYAPVGRHEELLPYLVRRLLENGANTSFINRIQDRALKIAAVIADPVTTVTELPVIPNPAIPAPRNVHGAAFESAPAPNLADTVALAQLAREISAAAATRSTARPTTPRAPLTGGASRAVNPADATDSPGTVEFADNAATDIAFALAASAWPDWERREVAERAALLRRAADRLVEHRGELLALLVREAGKCVPDAVAEWREAVELLRYYATEAERVAGSAVRLAGPTGELNELALRGRGTFVCISPWNFPLAIFTGQVGAALVAGNCVIAKPSEQACLVAARAVALLHAAGIPADVLQCLPGDGPTLGTALVADPRAAGVAFTGSVSAAQSIARTLAGRDAALGTLIAETGGINAMIVDSSALPEQVVPDVLQSAFNSAGQRCSALRILCLQRDIADAVIERLRGAMDQLVIGDPRWLATDIGPLIDQAALKSVEEYLAKRRTDILHRCALPAGLADGNWCPPAVLSINAIAEVTREIFGPVLHVLRFDGPGLARLIDDINAAGYGLTLGVHSRIGSRAREIAARALAGNVYVNRNMIGAMAGSQPFGGRGLSGTGPKAGGPGYLPRFMTEQTLTINTAAVGGNATLLSGG